MQDHILSNFNQALERLRDSALTMASLARKNLACAMRGLMERNTDLCNAAIAADQDVNELEKEIDLTGMQILLRFQPTAQDLRQVMGTIRVANNLERISDQAASIGKRARIINTLPEMPELNLIQPLYHLCVRNLDASIKSFIDGDADAAEAARRSDKELDAAEKTFDTAILRIMEAHDAGLESYLHLIFIARFLERIGDHAKNICEDAIFITRAQDVRFEKDKRAELEAVPA